MIVGASHFWYFCQMDETAPLDDDEPHVVPVRERILAAALQLIQEQGIHAMTQTKVCDIAGVRHSHLTYYFPTRVKLLKEVVMRGTETVLALLDGPEDMRVGSPKALRAALAELPNNRGLARMLVAVSVVSDEETSLKPWLDKFQMNGLLRFKRALELIGLKPPARAVEVFLACLIGTLHNDFAASSERSRKRAKAVIQYAFDQMVAASKGTQSVDW